MSVGNITVARNSALIMVAQTLGSICGLGFDIVTAATFGTSLHMDAFFVSLALPQMLNSVLVSNGIRVLAPLFTEAHNLGGERRLYIVFSGVVNLGILILSGVVLAGILGAPWVINLLAPGLTLESKGIAVLAIRILFLSLVPMAIVEPLRAIHIFHQRFFLASLANFFRYGAAILALISLRSRLDVLALGWAYVAGAVFQLVVFGLAFLAQKGMYRFTLGQSVDLFRLLMVRLGPPVIGEFVGQSNVLVERFFASFLSPGMLSAFGYGRRILMALNGLIANSVSVAILPRLSLEAVTQKVDELRQSVVFGTKSITLVTGLVTVLLIGLSFPLVTVLYQRGNFDLQATLTTATILSILAPSLLFMGMTQLFMLPYFAFGETKIILSYRILFLGIYTALSFAFLYLLHGYGLAVALPASLLIQLILWMRALSKRVKGFGEGFYRYLLKLALILACVGGALYLSSPFVRHVESLPILLSYGGIVILVGSFLFGSLSIGLGLISMKSLNQIYTALSMPLSRKWVKRHKQGGGHIVEAIFEDEG